MLTGIGRSLFVGTLAIAVVSGMSLAATSCTAQDATQTAFKVTPAPEPNVQLIVLEPESTQVLACPDGYTYEFPSDRYPIGNCLKSKS